MTDTGSTALPRLHRVLIASAMVMGVVYTAYSIREWRVTGDTQALVIAVMTALTTAGLGVYLRWFIKKSARAGSPTPKP